MAEEEQGQEKTEEATPRKLEKAREEGQVARSRELGSVAIVAFGAAAALFVAPDIALDLKQITVDAFRQAADINRPLPTYAFDVVVQALLAVLPLLIVLFGAGIAANLGVGGMVFAPKAIAPKLNRLSPIKGFGRMFSMKALVELGKSIGKFLLISGVAVSTLYVLLPEILFLSSMPLQSAMAQGLGYVGLSVLLAGLALIFIAAIDVPFQIAQHKKQLKMTKQEVRDELKNSEGKPEVKAKLRALQQQASQRKALDSVPEADVVITNPEHFSVAIKYDASNMEAPVLVAKGVDHMAFRIREIADANDVPKVAIPILARAIYYNTEIDQQMPESLYLAVAQVLAYVYQLEQYRRGQLDEAPVMANVEVPAGMDQPNHANPADSSGDLNDR